MKVFLIVALTADGIIGKHRQHLADWTTKEDKKVFVELTKQAGTMIMGSTTFNTIGKALPGRRTIVYAKNLQEVNNNQEIEITSEDPKELISRLQKEGSNAVAICGGQTIYTMFMKAGLVEELYLTIEPVAMGAGVGLFNDDINYNLELLNVNRLGPNVVQLHYKVKND